MRNISRLAAILLVAALVGGAVFLATWDIPAPTAKIEKVLTDERFPR